MAGLQKWLCTSFVFLCICFTLLWKVDTAADDTQDQYEDIYERQKQTFVDSLGYGDDRRDADTAREVLQHSLDTLDDISKDGLAKSDVRNVANDIRDGVKELVADETEDGFENVDNTREEFRRRRRRRSAGGTDPYELLAGLSGGSVIHTDKENISSAIDVLSSATLRNPVNVRRRTMMVHGLAQLNFSVDSSLTTIVIQVHTSCCKPKITVYNPSNHTVTPSDSNANVTVDTTTLYYLQIVRPAVGQWIIGIYDLTMQQYDVTIVGSSVVSFDSAFADSLGNRLSSQPIPDATSTYLLITPHGDDRVSNFTYLTLNTVNGTRMQSIPLGPPRGRMHLYLVPVVWPHQDVHIGVEGVDTSGHQFTREQPTLVQPLGVRLVLTHPGAEFIQSCNRSYRILFTFSVVGSSANLNLTVTSDNSKIPATISPTTAAASILPQKGTVTLNISNTTIDGETVTVNILASAPDGRSQYIQQTLYYKDIGCGASSTTANPGQLTGNTGQPTGNTGQSTGNTGQSTGKPTGHTTQPNQSTGDNSGGTVVQYGLWIFAVILYRLV